VVDISIASRATILPQSVAWRTKDNDDDEMCYVLGGGEAGLVPVPASTVAEPLVLACGPVAEDDRKFRYGGVFIEFCFCPSGIL